MSYIKNIVVRVLAVLMTFNILTITPVAAATKSSGFKDINKSQWFYETVMQASAMELFTGYPNGTFGPNDKVTRGQAVQVLYNHYGTDHGTSTGFSDVSDFDWYARAITWATKEKLVNGIGNNTFAPNDSLTREQLVSILYAKAGRPSVNANVTLRKYLDYKDVSSWARDAFAWAVKNGIVQGVSSNQLNPQGTATRAEMATIMIRYLDKIDGEVIPALGI